METDARAFWVVEPGRGEILPEKIGAAAEEELQVRALFSGISRGTEALVFEGRVPESEYQRMRAPFQRGEFPAPVKYGYSSVGWVEHGPRELEHRTVFVLHPHQTRYIVPIRSAFVLPADVPPERAVLAANLETAINGIWDAEVQVGDQVSVVGGGTVGCLVAWLASRIPGVDVELIDINPQRAAIADALGVQFVLDNSASPDRDVVIHTSGSPAGLQTALRIAGFEATVTEMSWYGNQIVPLSLGESFHARRLTLRSSQVGTVAATQRVRWDTRRRMWLALQLLAEPILDALITGESDFESLPAVMARLSRQPGEALCHRIRYS